MVGGSNKVFKQTRRHRHQCDLPHRRWRSRRSRTPRRPDVAPNATPSLAIECIFEHYVSAGVLCQDTLWQAQLWLARQHPLCGSPEFCNVVRSMDRQMVPRVAGMHMYPWPGIDRAPSPLAWSLVTLIFGTAGPVGKTVSMRALAQEYARALCSHDVQFDGRPCPARVTSFLGRQPVIGPESLREHLIALGSCSHHGIAMAYYTMQLQPSQDLQLDPIGDLEAMDRIVRLGSGLHLLLTVLAAQEIADPRVSSTADRIVIAVGPPVAL